MPTIRSWSPALLIYIRTPTSRLWRTQQHRHNCVKASPPHSSETVDPHHSPPGRLPKYSETMHTSTQSSPPSGLAHVDTLRQSMMSGQESISPFRLGCRVFVPTSSGRTMPHRTLNSWTQ